MEQEETMDSRYDANAMFIRRGDEEQVVTIIRSMDEEQAAEEARNPLEAYSTRQLKAELARRDRQRRGYRKRRKFF